MEESIPFCFVVLCYLPLVAEQSDGSKDCIRSVVVTVVSVTPRSVSSTQEFTFPLEILVLSTRDIGHYFLIF